LKPIQPDFALQKVQNLILMKVIINLLGGLAGAAVLTILHETVKRLDRDAPHIDMIGEEAIVRSATNADLPVPEGDVLFAAALAGDLVSNTMYYSLIGNGKTNNLLLRGVGYGLGAGLGALLLTEPLGLDDAPVTRTEKTKVLTVAWYIAGGITTALAIKAFRK
jgi:hypothetical protein